MTEQQYREIVVEFSKIAKKVGEIVTDPRFEMDKLMFGYKVREASNLLRDIRHMTDLKENPNKIIVEMNQKPTGAQDERNIRNVAETK